MPQQGDTVWAVISLAGSLIGFLLVLALAFFVTRRVAGGYFSGAGQSGLIRVLARQPLGPQQGLYLVKAGGRVFLLGVTPQRVDAVGELDAADIPDAPEGWPAPAGFGDLLRMAVKKKEESGNGTDTGAAR